MCIACELGLLIAMDALPDAPPPGFPRMPASADAAGFACDAPAREPTSDVQSPEDERRP
jgi:hypothetical protein